MKVTVTADDIARGIAHTPKHCPFARALRRVPGVAWAAVERQHFTISGGESVPKRIALTDDARAFVSTFDAGGKVAPGIFEVPDEPIALAPPPPPPPTPAVVATAESAPSPEQPTPPSAGQKSLF